MSCLPCIHVPGMKPCCLHPAPRLYTHVSPSSTPLLTTQTAGCWHRPPLCSQHTGACCLDYSLNAHQHSFSSSESLRLVAPAGPHNRTYKPHAAIVHALSSTLIRVVVQGKAESHWGTSQGFLPPGWHAQLRQPVACGGRPPLRCPVSF